VTWVSRKASDQGIAAVTIDGVSKGTVNLYAASPVAQSTRTYSGLPAGSHIITIKNTGTKASAATGTNIAVDAFKVGAVTTEESSLKITYDAWVGKSSLLAHGGSYRSASQAGRYVKLEIIADTASWYAETGPDQGKAQVTVDGANKGSIDLYAPAAAWQVPHVFNGLGPGSHSLVIMALGTKNPLSTGTQVSVDFVTTP
jgi:bacillopeptidase F